MLLQSFSSLVWSTDVSPYVTVVNRGLASNPLTIYLSSSSCCYSPYHSWEQIPHRCVLHRLMFTFVRKHPSPCPPHLSLSIILLSVISGWHSPHFPLTLQMLMLIAVDIRPTVLTPYHLFLLFQNVLCGISWGSSARVSVHDPHPQAYSPACRHHTGENRARLWFCLSGSCWCLLLPGVPLTLIQRNQSYYLSTFSAKYHPVLPWYLR